MKCPLAGVMAITLGAASAAAQTAPTDVQVWPSIAVIAPMGERLEIRADGILQLTDDVSRVSRELGRVVLIGRLNDRLAVGGGYTWTRVRAAAGGRSVEHRAVQEIDLRVPVGRDVVVFSSRTRVEERFQEQEAATAIRLRQLARMDVPLPLATRGVRAVVWSEYFHAINRTDWSGRSGPRLMLNFVGIHVPISKKTTIEPGYLNQTNFIAGRNQTLHVVAVFFTTRL